MKKTLIVPPIIILALVSAAVPLSVHHSRPVSNSQLETLKGSMTEFMRGNAHPMITLELPTTDGGLGAVLGLEVEA